MKTGLRRGFTLIEIVLVVAIISIALSIAIPSYMKMSAISKKSLCINSLKSMSSAIETWSIENDALPGTELTAQQETEIFDHYILGGKPKCPSGGTYKINPLGSIPLVECSLESIGHALPSEEEQK